MRLPTCRGHGERDPLEKKDRVDIYAVANRARVSPATVSRTINGASTVDAKLATRVWKAVRELNYQPKMHARALGSGRTRLIGLIVTDITNPFFPDMIRGFESAAVAQGYEILISSLDENDPPSIKRCIHRMVERSVDGIAALTFGAEQKILEELGTWSPPLVFVDFDASVPHAASLKLDYKNGIRQAVQHLAMLGHRQIAFLSGTLQLHTAKARLEAFLAGMQEIGVDVKEEWIYHGNFLLEGGKDAMERLLACRNRPTAMICSNDMSAIGALHAAHAAHLAIPDDFSIVGFDNINIAAYTYPPLTTVEMSGAELAVAAVEVLTGKLRGEEVPSTHTIQTKLIVRQTSGPVPRRRR
jgi:LacI family transcriptional regulator